MQLGEERQYPDADGQFDNCVNWNFNDGKLKFNNNWTDNANQNWGAASVSLSLRLFNMKRLPPNAEVFLILSHNLYPTAKHFTYFLRSFSQVKIFFIIYDFNLIG